MQNASNSTSPIQNFAPDATVQTAGAEGEWMLLSKASEVSGLHEKTLRRYIKKKLLRYRRLGKQSNSPLQVWITPAFMETVAADASVVEDVPMDIFEEDDETEESAEPEKVSSISPDVEKVIKIMTQQFAEQLDKQQQVLYTMRDELVEKEKKLLLIPNIQRELEEKARAVELKKIELEKEVEELRLELEKVQAEKTQLEQRPAPWWKSWFGVS